MWMPFTFREGLVVGGLALLCTATGIALFVEAPSTAGSPSIAEAVDLLRLWVSI
jgi:hypothetical protein